MLAAPLIRQGTALGTICVFRLDVRPFTANQIALLETFADQAVIAVENARLSQELRNRVEELQALGEVGQAVSSTLELAGCCRASWPMPRAWPGPTAGSCSSTKRYRASLRSAPSTGMATTSRPRSARRASASGKGPSGGRQRRGAVEVGEVDGSDVLTPEVRDRLLGRGRRQVQAVPLLREDPVLGGRVMSRWAPGSLPAEVGCRCSKHSPHSRRWRSTTPGRYRALAEASRHKSAFLATMSHELRSR